MVEKKIMLDLETMGTGSHAAVVAIGACVFSVEGGIADKQFYQVIDPSTAGLYGKIDGGTFAWWCTQSVDARKIFADKSIWKPTVEALKSFHDFCMEGVSDIRDIEVWGNGSDFDNVVLGNTYEAAGIKRPWLYSGNRCYRSLTAHVSKQQRKELWDRHSPGLVHHNALHDAIRQAKIAIDILRFVETIKNQQI